MWRHVNSLMGRSKVNADDSVKSPDDSISDADFINKHFVDAIHQIKSSQVVSQNSYEDYLVGCLIFHRLSQMKV